MARVPPLRKKAFHLKDGSILVADSREGGLGGISIGPRFAQVRYIKPEKQGFIKTVLNKFTSYFKHTPHAQTTEEGSAGSASPSISAMQSVQQRYERRLIIQDCWQMVYDDPRARRGMLKFAREATRGGYKIVFNKGISPRLEKKASEIADNVKEKTRKKVRSWAFTTLIEGDLFVQTVLAPDKTVSKITRMPAISMERNTNDADEFMDITKAFSQVDVISNEEFATFPEWMIAHARWNHIDGDKYGTPEAIAGRRIRRELELTEESQRFRRMVRAAQTRLWSIGDKDTVGEPQEVEKFKEENGFLEGIQEVFNPQNVARDFFGNGKVSVSTIPGDAGISDIGDILHDQEVYMMSQPTPMALIGLAAESINRDVLGDQRAEFLKETQLMCEVLEEIIRFNVDLALLLQGILPETVPYNVKWSDSDIDTPSEVIGRIEKARNMQPLPIISQRTAVLNASQYFGVEDPEAELEEIEREHEYQAILNAEVQAGQFGQGPLAQPMGIQQQQGGPPGQGGAPPSGQEQQDQGLPAQDEDWDWDLSELDDWMQPIIKQDLVALSKRNGHATSNRR